MLKLKKLLIEAPIGTFYIKVAVRDSRKALEIIDSDFRNEDIDISGDTYYFKDQSVAYDAMMEFHANDIEITGKSEDIEESVINEDKKITEAAEKIFDALVNARVTKKPYKRIAMKVIEFQLRAIRFGGL